MTALRRRVPHLPVVIYPAAVQGAQAPAELCAALKTAFRRFEERGESEVLLLVRGGGSLEDLWSFNDAGVVRTIAQAPMPVVCGVGHETDFTLADFVADLRAPTPTAAAELCSPAREQRLGELAYLGERLRDEMVSGLDRRAQRIDFIAQRLGRPSSRLHESAQRLSALHHRIQSGVKQATQRHLVRIEAMETALPKAVRRAGELHHRRLQTCETSLGMLDPHLVLERGYAYLSDEQGMAITRVDQSYPGQSVVATLADGQLGLTVDSR